MSTPQRIQRKRVKGWRMPEGAVYVGRPSKWGNPFRYRTPTALARVPAIDGSPWEYEGRISADGARHDFWHPGGQVTEHHVRYMTRAECAELYGQALTDPTNELHRWLAPKLGISVAVARLELSGKDLACWCGLNQPCHADVLLSIAAGGDGSCPPPSN